MSNICAQNMPVPVNIQAALLVKILKFNPKIAEKNKIQILIVYNSSSKNSKDELLAELIKTMDAKAVMPEELEQNIKNCDLVYFLPGLQEKTKACKDNKVLSITGISKYVEEGNVSIAFGLQNDKPKIFINVTSLKSEDQNFSSDILRIAKIYK
jgi:hypothetical protein